VSFVWVNSVIPGRFKRVASFDVLTRVLQNALPKCILVSTLFTWGWFQKDDLWSQTKFPRRDDGPNDTSR